jgi:hypothetical protein
LRIADGKPLNSSIFEAHSPIAFLSWSKERYGESGVWNFLSVLVGSLVALYSGVPVAQFVTQ